MTTEMIILVDPNDNPIGEVEKHIGHEYAMLHRAFSVVLFRIRNGALETLLQQRSQTKYHAGGLWTNTCCSHPNPGEDLKEAAIRRLKEEMGLDVPLKKAGHFHYVAILDKGMVENEIDHVFIGEYSGEDVPFNPDEVESVRWMNVDLLQQELIKSPSQYTPWFRQALEIALQKYSEPK